MSRSNLGGYLKIAGVAGLLSAQVAVAAEANSMPIKKIWVDASKQVVIDFAGQEGSFPAVPHVIDLPGPNHRIVFDFTDATIDKASFPSSEQLTEAVKKSLPFVRSVRYTNLSNTPKPTARVVLDVPEAVQVKPRVVKLEEGQVAISLGDEAQMIAAAAASEQPVAVAAVPESVAPVAEAAAPQAAPGAAPVAAETAAAPGAAPANVQPLAAANESGGATTTRVDDNKPAVEAPVADNSANPAWDWTGKNAAEPASSIAAQAPIAADNAETQLRPSIEAAGNSAAPVVIEAAAPATTPPASSSGNVAATPAEPVQGSDVPATPAAAGGGAQVCEPAAELKTEQSTAPAAVEEPAKSSAAPVDTKTAQQNAVKHYNVAVQFHLSGKLTEAVAEYKAALNDNPDLAEAHSNLGLIYNQQHNYAQALSEFRKALAINPKDAITYNGIGAALRAEKDLEGAIKNWQTAVSLDSHLATAHYNLGTAYEIQKEYDKAVDSYRQAVKNDYRLGEAYYRTGLIMERKHKMDDAVSEFNQALKVSGTAEYSEDARQRVAFLTKGKSSKQ